MGNRYWIGQKLFTVFTLAVVIAPGTKAGEFDWVELGIRSGVSTPYQEGNYHQSEVFTSFAWQEGLELTEHTLGTSYVEVLLGRLDGGARHATILAIGPKLELLYRNYPVALELSWKIAGLSEYRFEEEDLGGKFQFISGLGFVHRLGQTWQIGYRFQHISNAGLRSENPGLDQHMLSIASRF